MKVTIYSFSYKRVLNGQIPCSDGGFVFDCRTMPNPFWDESLRKYNGCDDEIKNFFLRNNDVVKPFFDSIERLVIFQIEAYKKLNYEHLQIAFGCTGGQHRSVYFAERLLAVVKKIPDIDVSVVHTAQAYWKE